jgi:hypothetical protein
MTRAAIAAMLALTVALGAGSRIFKIGVVIWDKSFGDVAYAVMVAFILLFVRPNTKAIAIGGIATAICFALELFQATGVPARAPRVLQIVLGTTFAWHDMACYAIGGVVATVAIILLTPRGASGSLPSK